MGRYILFLLFLYTHITMEEFPDNITLIGITGVKRSGKDTIGEYLCETRGFTRLGFADPLKVACKAIFSFTDEQLYGKDKETRDEYWGDSPRLFMQVVGSELFRETLPKFCKNVGSDIWVKSLERKMNVLYTDNPRTNNKFVITDVRFPNECKFISEMGGTMIRVNRPQKKVTDVHASEQHVKTMKVDYEVENDGTLKDLFVKVELLLK